MASQDKLLKVQQYERTKQLINDINFQKATELPMAAGAEGVSAPVKTRESSSFLLRRTQDSVTRNDMSLVRDHLKVLSEIDPANVYYSNLLTRLNHGEHITWKEFEDAVSRFSYNQQYLIKLQDEINNAKLAVETEGEIISDEAVQEPVQVTAVPEEKPPPEEIPQSEQPQDQESSHPEWRRRETPRPPLRMVRNEPQREKTPEQARDIKQKMEKSESLPQEQVKRNAMPERRAAATGSDKIRKVPQQALEDRQKKRTAAAFLRGRAGSGFGMPWVPKFLQRWLGQLGRGALNGALNLGRAAINAAARGLGQAAAQLLPRLGTQAALQAGRGVLFPVATYVATAFGPLIIALLVIGGLFIFLEWLSGANSECGKTGTPEITKTVTNGTTDTDGEKKFTLEEQINYTITVNYRLKCGGNFDAEVRDTIPLNTEYVQGSAKSPTFLTEFQGQTGVASVQGTQEGNTLIWKINKLPNNRPLEINFSVTPKQDNAWVVNESTARFTVYPAGGSTPLNLTGPSRGLLCTPGLDERLLRIIEEAGVAANVSPSIIYAIAKAENSGSVTPYSLDGKAHGISPCGAHGLMQIQHPNDGLGKNYPVSCGGAAPETWDGLSKKYNEISGGNIVDPNSDKDSIFGAAFYIKDSGWPASKAYIDQLTDAEAANIASRYLGSSGYASQVVQWYKDAYAKQGRCGGGVIPPNEQT